LPTVIVLAVTPGAVGPPLLPLPQLADFTAAPDPPVTGPVALPVEELEPLDTAAPELPEGAPADPLDPLLALGPTAPAPGEVADPPDEVELLPFDPEATELLAEPAVPPVPPDPFPSAAAVADLTSEWGTLRPQLLSARATRARPTTRWWTRLLRPDGLPPCPTWFTEPPVL
jgi:hypothetical protein